MPCAPPMRRRRKSDTARMRSLRSASASPRCAVAPAARAIARALYEGRALLVFFARLILISGMAPVIAPVLGGQLSLIMS